MFESLRDAFREAVKNFKEELHRDEVPEAVDKLVYGMKREAADARARLQDLEEGIRRAKAEAAIEAQELEKCQRRERMALSIGDAETAKIAVEYGAKHQRRLEVLQQKTAALDQELTLRRAEADEMVEKIRAAEKERDSLAASVGRTQARESVRSTDPLFDELDRMAELMGGGKGTRGPRPGSSDPIDELDRDVETELFDRELRPETQGPDLDARLAELKRRMGQS
jgi:phage shock protein A